MLDTVKCLPNGTTALVEADVADIAHRIVHGDPTLNWMGDESLALFVDTEVYESDSLGKLWTGDRTPNPYYGWFEVWGVDAQGTGYFVGRWERCDARILADLAAAHWTNGNPADRAIAQQERNHAARDAARKEARMEGHEKLHHALIRRNGAHYGSGLTRHNLLGRA